MLHSILYAYNLASPRTKRAARAGAAFLAGAALAVLATACSPAHAGAAHGTIAPKPRGPVLETPQPVAFASPSEKRAFVLSKISRCRHSGIGMVSGGMAVAATPGARLQACFEHPAHLLPVERQMVDSLGSPVGTQTMTATPVASASARTPNALNIVQDVKTPTTSEAQAFALLQALSDATMARLYLHKGNLPAARRKAVQLLKALQVLEVQQ